MGFDLVVVGEPLLEFSASAPLTEACTFQLGFSGDALNAAVAAAAAGARVGLLTRLGEDELSDRLVAFLADRGVDTSLVRREPGQTGAYVLGADPSGTREFAYLRAGSAATRLEPSDVDKARLAEARAVLLSGITAALSPSCAATVLRAAQTVHAAGGIVVYDPNFRPRLTTPDAAAAFFRAIAPYVSVAIPSSPADTRHLFGLIDPAASAAGALSQGAAAAVITCGANGSFIYTSPTLAGSAADPGTAAAGPAAGSASGGSAVANSASDGSSSGSSVVPSSASVGSSAGGSSAGGSSAGASSSAGGSAGVDSAVAASWAGSSVGGFSAGGSIAADSVAGGSAVAGSGAGDICYPVVHVPVVAARRIVDSTGAGDCFAGTLAARLAVGDDLLTAVRLGSAAASLSLGGQGGTGYVPSLQETRAHLARERA